MEKGKVMGQDGEQKTAGVAGVRAVLVEGLSGWDRPRRMEAGAFAAMRDRLCERLAYMDPDALAGLVDLIRRSARATPPAVPRWPDAGVIEAWAAALCPRPVFDREGYVRSLLGSAMGRQARADRWLVELLRHARRAGPPPQAYSLHKLREAAADAARRRALMDERPDRVTDEDRAWWAAYQADQVLALALVDAGAGTGGASAGGDAA